MSLTFCAYSQDPYHVLYGIEDGLPSEEVYDVYVDSIDMIWTTTDRGVSQYDGYSFSNFSTADGLAYNTNFKIKPDSQGRLWFLGHDASISIYEDGQFYKAPFSDTLQNMIVNRYYYDLIFDDEGNHYLTYTGLPFQVTSISYIKISNEGKITEVLFDSNSNTKTNSNKFSVIEKNVGNQSILRIEPFNFVPLNPIKIDNENSLFLMPNKVASIAKALPPSTSASNQVFSYKNNEVNPVIKSDRNINNIGKDKDGNIILCTDNGILIYKYGDLSRKPNHYFVGSEFSDFDQDKNGNYWISSSKDGLYFVPSFKTAIIPIRIKEKLVQKLVTYDNHLFFKYGINQIDYIDKDYNVSRFISKPRKNNEKPTKGKQEIEIFLEDGEYFMSEITLPFALMKPSIYLPNGDFLALFSSQIFRKDAKSLTFSNISFDSNKSRVKEMKIYKNDLYISSLRSFFLVKNGAFDKAVNLGEKNILLNVQINDFEFDQNGNRWIATVGNGILINKDDHSTTQFNSKNGLSSNLYNTLYFQNDTTLWAGSNSGLERIILDFQDDNVKIKKVDKFNIRDGLLSNYINDIIYWNEKIWVASKEGLQGIQPDLQSKVEPPAITIENMKINETIQKKSSPLKFDYYQNDISIAYKAITYDRPKDDLYRYKLNKNKTTSRWTSTNDRTARYTNLSPGKYSFFVSARNKNNIWSESESISFQILPHFTSTWWFWIIAGLVALATAYWIYLQRIRYIIKKDKAQRALQESRLRTEIAELSTFRNQFNPHFIFNSLNSIQNYIFDKDVRQANSFLSKFSKLIRESLNLSDNKLVSIEKEFAFIKSYLEIEFLRFPDKFAFEFHNEDDIPIELYQMPPLLIQPVIENVVKHAFKGTVLGKLNISVKQHESESGMIMIIIEDNGTGIKLAEENIQNDKHKSFGIKIVHDRIKLLNNDYPYLNSSFTITNKASSSGTIAKFVIPKITIDQA